MPSVLLVNPDFNDAYSCFPLPLSVLSASLLEAGYTVQVLDLDGVRDDKAIDRRILGTLNSGDIGLIGITGMITTYRSVRDIIAVFRRHAADVPIVVGGSLAATAPKRILDSLGADYLVMGDGELPLTMLANALFNGGSLDDIPNLVIRNGTHWEANQQEAWTAQVEGQPMPSYDLFDVTRYISPPRFTHLDVFSGRGCVMNCSFCFKMSGNRIRKKTPQEMISELIYLHDHYGLDRFNFVDDNFGLTPKWIEEFLVERSKCGFDFRWRFQASANTFRNPDFIQRMRDNGLGGVSMGLETGSETLQRVIGKNLRLDHAERVIGWIREAGVALHASFILGFPDETPETVAETEAFIRRNDLSGASVFFLTPYPGTEIWEHALSSDHIPNPDTYVEALASQHDLNANLTNYPDAMLLNWREQLLTALQAS